MAATSGNLHIDLGPRVAQRMPQHARFWCAWMPRSHPLSSQTTLITLVDGERVVQLRHIRRCRRPPTYYPITRLAPTVTRPRVDQPRDVARAALPVKTMCRSSINSVPSTICALAVLCQPMTTGSGRSPALGDERAARVYSAEGRCCACIRSSSDIAGCIPGSVVGLVELCRKCTRDRPGGTPRRGRPYRQGKCSATALISPPIMSSTRCRRKRIEIEPSPVCKRVSSSTASSPGALLGGFFRR